MTRTAEPGGTGATGRGPVRRHWVLGALLAAGLVAVGVWMYAVRPRSSSSPRAFQLPTERSIEARFTGPRFAPHRPYRARRGGQRVDAISLAALAELEQRHALPDLIAALAVTGNVGRARDLAATLPASASAESDRAALALVGGDSEQGLEHAYQAIAIDPTVTAAWWNLALAARAHGLRRVARDAFQRVASRDEPGWSVEARAQIAALDRELEPEIAYASFMERGRAMIAGGPVIDVADVRRFPAFARIHVLDAIRVAGGARLEQLRPLARELDALSGAKTMTNLLDRAAAADPAVRARFADRYRTVLARKASSEEVRKLVDELKAAGPDVDDIRAGAIIAGNHVDTYIDDLTALATAWQDPWFGIVAKRVRIMMMYPPGDLRAIPALTAALDECDANVWSMRCGQIAEELAQRLFDSGRAREAEVWAKQALDWYERGATPTYAHIVETLLGDIHRNLGRTALARAELEEIVLATETTSCALRRYATIALAEIDFERDEVAAVRDRLPDPVAEQGCNTSFELQAVTTAVDLARATGDPADIARAKQWIDRAATPENPLLAGLGLTAKLRLARGHESTGATALREWLAAHPAKRDDPWRAASRTWAFTTLMADAGTRQEWSTVLELSATEHPGSANAPCAVAINLDVRELTVAARSPAGVMGDHRTIEPAELGSTAIVPASIAKALAQCDGIAVDARQPLHGRADLLPAELPWFFIGDAPPVDAPAKPWRALEITSPRPPDPSLPALPDPGPSAAHFERSLAGAEATPSRVLAELTNATYVEIHAHGIVSAAEDDAAFLALSPDADGTYTLHAATLRKAKLARAPIVVLAACRAAAVAPYYQMRWSLPDAFVSAGAHAVVAADVPIPDAEARATFDELHRRIDASEPVHAALAAIRRAAPSGSWQRHLIVFR